jgi:hypothetical protein
MFGEHASSAASGAADSPSGDKDVQDVAFAARQKEFLHAILQRHGQTAGHGAPCFTIGTRKNPLGRNFVLIHL